MAYIEKRKTEDGTVKYRVQVRMKGCKNINATFAVLTKAKKWIQNTESSIREGRYFKTLESKKHSFADLVDRYIRDILPRKPKSARKQQLQLLWWKEKIGHLILADVLPPVIAELRDLLLSQDTVRKTKRSPATVVRYMAILSHAFMVAVKEWGWLKTRALRKGL